jgi:hypothetical protein
MNAALVAAFENKTASEILQELGIRIYQPPLSDLRSRLRGSPPPFHVPVLVIDLDTELAMQGILGFLQNSTGHYLDLTIEALDAIGARRTAATMARIHAVLARHDADPSRRPPGDTYIAALWANGGDAIRHEICAEASQLYLYQPHGKREDVFGMLERFIGENREALLRVICDCAYAA